MKSEVSVFITAASQKGTRHLAQQLAAAPAKCRELWTSLAAASAKHGGLLHRYNLKALVQAHQATFKDLLGVQSAGELVALLDQDEDGVLNQDEQLLLFAVVKEQMQRLLPELAADGSLHQQLVSAIRQLETDIFEYQSLLRQKANHADLQLLIQHRQSRLASFNAGWDCTFKDLHETHQAAVQTVKARHTQEFIALARSRPSTRRPATSQEFRKREMQYVLTQQYAAAASAKAAATQIEVQSLEQERLRTATAAHNSQNRLKAQQAKELNFLEMKFQAKLRQLVAEKAKQQTRLENELNVRFSELSKQQGHSARLSQKLATHRDEVRRRVQAKHGLKKCKSQAGLQSAGGGVPSSAYRAFGVRKSHQLEDCVQAATRLPVQATYTSARLRQALGTTAPAPALSALYNCSLAEVGGNCS